MKQYSTKTQTNKQTLTFFIQEKQLHSVQQACAFAHIWLAENHQSGQWPAPL